MSEDKVLDHTELWERLSNPASFEDPAYDAGMKLTKARSMDPDPERMTEEL